MRPIRFIVVHTAASYDAQARRVVHQTVHAVRRFHTLPVKSGGRGWLDIGYHRYVEQDGAIRMGRSDERVGAHAEGLNDHSLGICCSGHGDYEHFTAAQMRSLVEQCASWCRLYGVSPDNVIGHRETSSHGGPPVSKTCPGKLIDMGKIRHLVRDELGGVPPTQREVEARPPAPEPSVTRRDLPRVKPREPGDTMIYDPKLTPAAVTAVDAFFGALNLPAELRQGVKLLGALETPVVAAVTALIGAIDNKDEAEARKAYEAARRAAFAARQQ